MEEIFLHDLRPASNSRAKRKRVGRGHGSGMGKTSGRGHKGYNSRSGGGVSLRYEGGQMPLHMRLPKLRGSNKKMSMPIGPFRTFTVPVNIGRLADHFEAGDVVTPELLAEKGIVKKVELPVKILGSGDLGFALTVKAHGFSASARTKIEEAGGTVEVI